jgi:hypothetical protein
MRAEGGRKNTQPSLHLRPLIGQRLPSKPFLLDMNGISAILVYVRP